MSIIYKNNNIELLRFATMGNVDNGKSTLIGRLLVDTKSLFDDHYEDITKGSEKRGDDFLNLALVTDGLKEEREQGITIDVAYRYFSTPKRKFIIADTPGHVQFTRNMVTGASTAHVALILIDASKGITEQTKRHTLLASTLRIPNLLVCINKMDLVQYDEEVYTAICNEFKKFASGLESVAIDYIPISALQGDNVVHTTEGMAWYEGATLLDYLEKVPLKMPDKLMGGRFPVQHVIHLNDASKADYRGYAGRVASGVFRKGDEVQILPSGLFSRISKIDSFDGELKKAEADKSVTILLEDNLDVNRGDMIVSKNHSANLTQDLDVMICWFNEKSMHIGTNYLLKHTTNEVGCVIKEVVYKLDINTLDKRTENSELEMNDIAQVKIRSQKPLCIDSYQSNRITGSLILIDAYTFETVAAGMLLE